MIKVSVGITMRHALLTGYVTTIEDEQLRNNLKAVMDRIDTTSFVSLYDFMYKFDEAMMMLAGLNITYEASHYDPDTWLVYTTNDIFISRSGYTGIRFTYNEAEYYDDSTVEITYGKYKAIC